MKNLIKIVIIPLLLLGGVSRSDGVVFAQIDTANWSLTANQSDGKFTLLTNRSTYQGKSAGTIIIPIVIDASVIDTSIWSFLPSQVNTGFPQVTNKNTYYGKPANSIIARLTYQVNSTGSSLYGYSYKDSTTTFSVQQKYLTGTASVDAGHSSSAAVTLNKQYGNVTVSNQSTSPSDIFTLTINNSIATTSSTIIPFMEDDSGFGSFTGFSVLITNRSNGSFIVQVKNLDASNPFSDNFTIHFMIQN